MIILIGMIVYLIGIGLCTSILKNVLDSKDGIILLLWPLILPIFVGMWIGDKIKKL